MPAPALTPDAVRAELLRLRQGPALGHPGAVTALSSPLRALLLSRQPPLSPAASETTRLVAALRRAIDGLSPHERRYATADFNLVDEHSWPTLTERQESLARVLRCSVKTVRRHAGQALDSLALLISDGSYLTGEPPETDGDEAEDTDATARFFGIGHNSNVHVVCSTMTRPRRSDPTPTRYGAFADLDALVYTRVHLAQAFPTATIRDFYPGEYYAADPDCLIILGSPHRNTVYREFGPHLPYRFAEPPDADLTFPGHGNIRFGPLWAPEGELLADLTVITRLTLDQGTTVILLGGCHTLGVLGAAKALLNNPRNTAHLDAVSDHGDFVAVTTTRKIGGITDTPDLTTTDPLLLLTRDQAGGFTTHLDNAHRHPGAEEQESRP
ncbi:hypothetical protein [Streptomyces acidiscabies]|uniref:Uncharacterized protein n=1 Tax=Streptomyces acidiscabies TaxID=42234 RepID=A0AAP6EKY2_9ACTN|nr:hypothetical protein [Streptomyces acidiscabies]MBP5936764.1 hypothetical protein [Streptomyces sp. LBUM 1476]MBZ3915229.1 hypothetical protein [Streptomyces acidiscabies]MDX2966080.1 hypothetical protein [Streptomyces acidiscabies]MDX3021291.1 hypothetical protein [Streptomyces acidiscabies]MDX3793456.1 hypothetical protein [Streptomyces acidiscabies]